MTVPYYLLGLEDAIGTPTISVVQPDIILVDSIARRKRNHRCQRHPLRHGQSLVVRVGPAPTVVCPQSRLVAASSRTTFTNSTMSSLRVRQFTTVGRRVETAPLERPTGFFL